MQSAERTVLKNVRLIDGTGAPARENAAVVLQGGRIERIGSSNDAGSIDDARTIDGKGRSLVPGLMDIHTHSVFESEMPAYIKKSITTIRFAGVPLQDVARVREKAARKEFASPNIYSCGPMLDAGKPQFPDWTRGINTPQEAKAVATELMELEGPMRVDALIAMHRITPDLARALVEVASAYGRPVLGQFDHTSGDEAARVGITQVENTSRIFASREYPKERLLDYTHDSASERLSILFKAWPTVDWDLTSKIMDEMVEAGVRYCPTLIVFEHMSGRAVQERIERHPDYALFGEVEKKAHDELWHHIEQKFTDEDRENCKRTVDKILEWMSRFKKRGGRLLTGTDMQYSGIVYHDELEYFSAAGLGNADVLKAATCENAVALGIDAEVGTVEAGKKADLVLVDGDPLAKLSVLRDPAMVIKDGAIAYQAPSGGSRP